MRAQTAHERSDRAVLPHVAIRERHSTAPIPKRLQWRPRLFVGAVSSCKPRTRYQDPSLHHSYTSAEPRAVATSVAEPARWPPGRSLCILRKHPPKFIFRLRAFELDEFGARRPCDVLGTNRLVARGSEKGGIDGNIADVAARHAQAG